MEKLKNEILDKNISLDDLKLIEVYGHYFGTDDKKKKLTTSQLRKFFGAVKKIQIDFDNTNNEIPLLIPKIAYAVGRDKNNTKIKEFYDLVKPLIEYVGKDISTDKEKSKKRFQNFVNILEAIVAYHKEVSKEN